MEMADNLTLAPLEDERAIRHITDLLFIYTDQKEWSAARQLFVDGPIEVDMSSLAGGGPIQMTADELLAGFRAGLHEDKPSHHMTTNYRITVTGDQAEVWAHGYAWNRLLHYQAESDLWETWGNYRLPFQRTTNGWRLKGFCYFAKYNCGNDYVRTHAC